MASAYKKGKTWYLRYKDSTGRWRAQASTAQTKTEAKRLAHELATRAERERCGLAPPSMADGGGTLAELLQWWLDTYSSGTPSHAINASFIGKHLMTNDLARLPLTAVTSGRVETFLQSKSRDLKPRSVNHLRGYISRVFNAALKVGRFHGVNPVAQVAKRRVPKGVHDYLREHEVLPVLDNIPRRWRPLFAAAIYTGQRKGELLGLRKSDVDLLNHRLTVARSL
jgi:integrase